MLTSNKSRLLSLLIFVAVFALIVCMMSVTVFAHDDHDHDDDKKDSVWDKVTKWGASTAGQITGFSIAGVLFVGMVVFIILWIPKKTDKKEKKAVTKKAQ